jgi:hypothetical protein
MIRILIAIILLAGTAWAQSADRDDDTARPTESLAEDTVVTISLDTLEVRFDIRKSVLGRMGVSDYLLDDSTAPLAIKPAVIDIDSLQNDTTASLEFLHFLALRQSNQFLLESCRRVRIKRDDQALRDDFWEANPTWFPGKPRHSFSY